MLEVLLVEHAEDLARLGGYSKDTRAARYVAEERVRRRVAHRLPWLLVGLSGAVLAPSSSALSRASGSRRYCSPFFLPGVVYLADAVGTQTETLVILGLSVGVTVGRVVRLELVTGLIMGLVLGGAFFPVGVLG